MRRAKTKFKSKLVIANSSRKRSSFENYSLRQKLGAVFSILLLISIMVYSSGPVTAAGIDDVSVTLVTSEAVNTASQVQVDFTFGTLVNGDTIRIYLGETTAGDEWQLNAVTTTDISCSDDGTGEAYTVNSVTAASGTVAMYTQITATTVGAAATAVQCLIGDGTPNPINPISADGYSVAVVTTSDSGAGIAYVGDANDVTVSVDVLPNLALTIDNADATNCVTTSGVTACALGTVLTTTVVTGNYDVNVGTNAGSGATLTIDDDGAMRNGADDIDDVVEGNTVTAGTEGYGVQVVSDGSWTEQGNFTDDDTPIADSAESVAVTAGPISISGDDVTITHRAAIDSTTKSLTYSHIVTWTATGNF